MISIHVYSCSDSPNALRKSNLREIASLEGILREQTSILHPSVLLDMKYFHDEYVDDSDGMMVADEKGSDIVTNLFSESPLSEANYAYIPSFNRYYFIRDIVQVSAHLIRLEMDVDPLMSFADRILDRKAKVTRNERAEPSMMPDSEWPMMSENQVLQIEFPQDYQLASYSFSRYIGFNSTFNPTERHIAVSVVNNQDVASFQSSSSIACPSYMSASSIRPINLLPEKGTCVYFMTTSEFNTFAKSITSDYYSSMRSFIKSIIFMPFAFTNDMFSSTDAKVYLGDRPILKEPPASATERPTQDAITSRIGYLVSPYLTIAGIRSFGFTNELDAYPPFWALEPYSKAEIYIPFHGWASIDASAHNGHSLTIFYSVNYSTGKGTAYLYDVNLESLIGMWPSDIGVHVTLDTTNAQALNIAMIGETLRGIGDFGQFGLNFGKSILQNGLSMPQTMLGGYRSLASAITNRLNIQASYTAYAGTSDGTGWYYADALRPQIRYTYHPTSLRYDAETPSDEYASYAKTNGIAIPETMMNLSDLHGYTRCSDVQMNGIEGATKAEIESIKASLLSGVYLP